MMEEGQSPLHKRLLDDSVIKVGKGSFAVKDAIENNKIVMQTMEEARRTTKFEKRHANNVSYQLAPDFNEKVRYFDDEGERHPERINEVGTVAISVSNNNKDDPNAKSLYELPTDDTAARKKRIEVFEAQANNTLQPCDNFDAFEPFLGEQERILVTLDCSEINGYPATTTTNATLKGLVKVSIIQHDVDGLRLYFSLAKGTKEIHVKERFYEAQSTTDCICCFLKVSAEGASDFLVSQADMDYTSGSFFSAQFFTLPVTPTLINAMCYRASVNEFNAKSVSAGAGSNGSKKCYNDCPSCKFTCCEGCQCKLPVCCGMENAAGDRTIDFKADDLWPWGKVKKEFAPIVNQPSEEKGDVQWRINSYNEENIYVLLHYRSLLDNRNRTCKMRMQKSSDIVSDYNTAKKFVSILGYDRNRILYNMKYWDTNPNMSIDPVADPRRFNNMDELHRFGLSGSTAASAVGALAICYETCQCLNAIYERVDNPLLRFCLKTCCPFAHCMPSRDGFCHKVCCPCLPNHI